MSKANTIDKSGGVAFLDSATVMLHELDLTTLKQVAEPLHLHPTTSPAELDTHARDAWCVITNKVELDRKFFETHPGLGLVCAFATGTNNIDLEAAREANVAVVNCRGYSTESVAQHCLMMVLALKRNFQRYLRDVNKGEWERSAIFCLNQYPIEELSGQKLGIVGYGDIGQRVAELGKAFGMYILISERPGQIPRSGRMDFEEVLEAADILSLHCPLTEETAKLINKTSLQRMKKTAVLINTARGGLIDEEDLLVALGSKQIAGAALDVLSNEPPRNNPLLQANLENLIISPHNAWSSRSACQQAIEQTAENIQAWLENKALRRVV